MILAAQAKPDEERIMAGAAPGRGDVFGAVIALIADVIDLICIAMPSRGTFQGMCGVWQSGAYLRLSSIQSTVALTCSSVSAGLPPLAGITPPSGPV